MFNINDVRAIFYSLKRGTNRWQQCLTKLGIVLYTNELSDEQVRRLAHMHNAINKGTNQPNGLTELPAVDPARTVFQNAKKQKKHLPFLSGESLAKDFTSPVITYDN